ncbi:MAG: cellulase family glycosylhydrolase [Pseudomonadota bacterium]
MFIKRRIYALALLVLAPWATTQAANLPTPSIANSPGVSIHFVRGNTKDLDMMAAAGVKIVRTDFKWDAIEYMKGRYDWSAYDELVTNITTRGMRPYFILDYSNSLYETVKVVSQNGVWSSYIESPNDAKSVAAFAAWAKAAALRYQSKNVIWEIWNEPNISFWKPTPNVTNYTTLAKATCNAIHGAVPSAAVIGGATSGIDWNFLSPFLSSGILDCVDGISVHPYRGQTPDSVSGEYQYLAWLIDQSAPSNRKGMIPVINSEWGYTTVAGGLPQADQANFLVRSQLVGLLNNVPISIWYDWKNDGSDPNDYEHNFGMVNADLTPKPAYQALKSMTTQLSGYQLMQRVAMPDPYASVLIFVNAAGKYKLVVWTSASSYAITLFNGITANAIVPVTDISGVTNNVAINWSGITLTLKPSPQYVDLANLPLAAP